MTKRGYPWRSFLGLMLIGSVACGLSLPRPFRPATFAIIAAIVTLVIAAGLFFAGRIGADEVAREQSQSRLTYSSSRTLAAAFGAGIGLGGILFATLRILGSLNPHLLARLFEEAALPLWIRAIIAFDSAVLEEIFFRLFLLSACLYFLSILARLRKRNDSAVLFWVSNVLVSILFGVAHLPSWAAVGPISPALAVTVLLLNGLAGLALGYTYWRWGIFAAMAMHFAADLVTHAAGPLCS